MKISANFSNHYLKLQKHTVSRLSAVQKKIIALVLLALGLLTACAIIHRSLVKAKKAYKKLQHGSYKEKPYAPVTTKDGGNSYLYLKPEHIEGVGFVENEVYRKAVANLPICCVDIFLFNPIQKEYLMVFRKDPPAENTWWLPGGKLNKGESFFDCCQRKCFKEVGLKVTPQKKLGSAATLFPNSMWGTQTHTVNTFVLATLDDKQSPKLDQTSEQWEWKPLSSTPNDPYLKTIHQKAVKAIERLKL